MALEMAKNFILYIFIYILASEESHTCKYFICIRICSALYLWNLVNIVNFLDVINLDEISKAFKSTNKSDCWTTNNNLGVAS